MNLVEALTTEILRNQELLEAYKNIGPAGTFGATCIKLDIDNAIRVQGQGDVIEMLRIYEVLKENQ